LSINIEVHRDRKKAKEIIIIMGHEEIEVEKKKRNHRQIDVSLRTEEIVR